MKVVAAQSLLQSGLRYFEYLRKTLDSGGPQKFRLDGKLLGSGSSSPPGNPVCFSRKGRPPGWKRRFRREHEAEVAGDAGPDRLRKPQRDSDGVSHGQPARGHSNSRYFRIKANGCWSFLILE